MSRLCAACRGLKLDFICASSGFMSSSKDSDGIRIALVGSEPPVQCAWWLGEELRGKDRTCILSQWFKSLLCGACSGLVSGSADHDIKFWEWQVLVEEATGSRQLSLAHTRTLKMTDDVLCIRISPDGEHFAPRTTPAP